MVVATRELWPRRRLDVHSWIVLSKPIGICYLRDSKRDQFTLRNARFLGMRDRVCRAASEFAPSLDRPLGYMGPKVS